MCRTWGLIHPTSESKGLTIFHSIMSSHSLFFTCNNLSFTVLPFRFHLFVKKLVPASFIISLPLLNAYHVYWLLLISKWDTIFLCAYQTFTNKPPYSIRTSFLESSFLFSLNLVLGFVSHVEGYLTIHLGYLQLPKRFHYFCSYR